MKLTPTDCLLMVLAAVVIALLAFGVLMRPAGSQTVPDAGATATDPAPTSCADTVVLAVTPSPTATLEPTAVPVQTPEPDKPAYAHAIPLTEDLQIVLRDACEECGVDLALVLGVIEVESSFDPTADNGLCYGLMQLNRRYFPDDLTPGENIRVGVEYLGQLLVRYDTVEAALTAYNAGHDTGARGYANTVLAAVERWRGII